MSVLIDGNNLLYAALDDSPDRPPGRARLCDLVAQWAGRLRERVTIVFDGPQPPEALAAQIAAAGVTVQYSGSRKADDVLFERIAQDSAPRRLTVVSSDREVIRAARRRQAVSEKSADFWLRLLADLAAPPPQSLEPAAKRRGPEPGSQADWLDVFDVPAPPTLARLTGPSTPKTGRNPKKK